MKINLNPFHNPLSILTKLLLFLPRKKSFLKEQQVYSYPHISPPSDHPSILPSSLSSIILPLLRILSSLAWQTQGSSFEGGARCWHLVLRTLSNVSFASFASFVEDYQRGGGSISLRVAGWPTPHPWQARAKQMSHCHAKGSPLACNVFRDTLHVPSFACWKLLFFFFRKRGQGGG